MGLQVLSNGPPRVNPGLLAVFVYARRLFLIGFSQPEQRDELPVPLRGGHNTVDSSPKICNTRRNQDELIRRGHKPGIRHVREEAALWARARDPGQGSPKS
jgi:hypothetical protein